MTKKTLSVFMLTMINVATIGSIKNWPVTAEYGLASVTFFILATLIFFIPTALVSAELATGWPQRGGVFVWVKEAFGHRTGFLAAWLLWTQNIVWYPTALSFIAASIAYVIQPSLAGNPIYTFFMILIVFWAVTLVNLKGMRTSGWISTLGMILGTFLPGLAIIALGGNYFASGRELAIDFSLKSLMPSFGGFNQLALFTGVLISLAGLEMSAVHALDVKNPKKSYPKAIFFSLLIILALSIPGVLSIAIVVPKENLSLFAGSLQAINLFFQSYGLGYLLPLMATLITIGTIASVSTWVVGPTKGLLAAAQAGDLPPRFRKVNTRGMPTPLLIAQAIIVTFLSLLFVFLPTLDEAYWTLLALTSELYLIMYVLMFAAAIKLRYKFPQKPRPYKIPFGNVGVWIVGLIGIISSLFTIFVGLFPPQGISGAKTLPHILTMLGGILLFCLAPSWILKYTPDSSKSDK